MKIQGWWWKVVEVCHVLSTERVYTGLKIPLSHFQNLYYTTGTNIFICFCSRDYVKITNVKDQELRVFCGQDSGRKILLDESFAFIMFHSDGSNQKRGFKINYTAVPAGKLYNNEVSLSNIYWIFWTRVEITSISVIVSLINSFLRWCTANNKSL